MAMFAISKNLFRRFYNYSPRRRQAVIGRQTNNSYLLKRFDSGFVGKFLKYFCSEETWITITLVNTDGSRYKRKAKTGDTLYDVLYGDPDFPGYGECRGTMACSTCHVIFTKEDFDTVCKHNVEEVEEGDLLAEIEVHFKDCEAEFQTDTSRLGCCVKLFAEMDGMVIKLPKTKSLQNK